MRASALLLISIGLLTSVESEFADTVSGHESIDCSDVRLQRATFDTTTQRWSYEFAGVCKYLYWRTFKRGGSTKTIADPEEVEFVTGVAWWNQQTNQADESVTIGVHATAGEMAASYRCSTDPFVSSVSCAGAMNHDGKEWAMRLFRTREDPNRPLFAARTNITQREALKTESKPLAMIGGYAHIFSADGGVANADQTTLLAIPSLGAALTGARPDADAGVTANPALIAALADHVVIEAESLVPAAHADRGGAHVQEMAPFGPDWGGGAQLFWNTDDSGTNLIAPMNVGGPATWEATGYFTKAPDYGTVELRLTDAQAAAPQGWMPPRIRFDGYSEGVEGPVAAPLGRITVSGPIVGLALTVSGRNPASSGYLVGLDRIEFRRVAR